MSRLAVFLGSYTMHMWSFKAVVFCVYLYSPFDNSLHLVRVLQIEKQKGIIKQAVYYV